MPDNKRHHFVPKFYLRNFSINDNQKTVGIFHIPNNKFIASGGIKHQACKDYYYGKGGAEKALDFIESNSSIVINRIINTQEIPIKNSGDNQMLLLFLVILDARTTYAEERLNAGIDKMFKYVLAKVYAGYDEEVKDKSIRIGIKDAVQVSIRNAAFVAPITFDLDCKLICNESPHSFIASDNPVVLYNQYLEQRRPEHNNIGFVTKGLEIFVPISPQHCLVFFDGDVYKVGEKNNIKVNIKDLADVESINRLQYINAQQNLYFNESVTNDYLRRLTASSARYRGNSEVELQVNEDDPKRILLYEKLTEERCDLQLSFIKVLKKAKRTKINFSATVIYRNEKVEALEKVLEAISSKV